MKKKVIMTALFAAVSCNLQADPISGTGFSADAIAEKEGVNPDEVTDYGGLARWVFAEEGSPSIDTTCLLYTSPSPRD